MSCYILILYICTTAFRYSSRKISGLTCQYRQVWPEADPGFESGGGTWADCCPVRLLTLRVPDKIYNRFQYICTYISASVLTGSCDPYSLYICPPLDLTVSLYIKIIVWPFNFGNKQVHKLWHTLQFTIKLISYKIQCKPSLNFFAINNVCFSTIRKSISCICCILKV